jgi:hypothetical protein
MGTNGPARNRRNRRILHHPRPPNPTLSAQPPGSTAVFGFRRGGAKYTAPEADRRRIHRPHHSPIGSSGRKRGGERFHTCPCQLDAGLTVSRGRFRMAAGDGRQRRRPARALPTGRARGCRPIALWEGNVWERVHGPRRTMTWAMSSSALSFDGPIAAVSLYRNTYHREQADTSSVWVKLKRFSRAVGRGRLSRSHPRRGI